MKKIINIILVLLVIYSSTALAGTFQQVVQGAGNPEITIQSTINTGQQVVGKIYYWAGDGSVIEAETAGATMGAVPVITSSVSTNLTVRVLFWNVDAWPDEQKDYCPIDGYKYYYYDSIWKEWHYGKNIITYGELFSRNIESVTLFYDRDTQFGNGNEVEIKDYNPTTSIFYEAWQHGSEGVYTGSSACRSYLVPANYSQLVFFGSKTWTLSNPSLITQDSLLNPGENIYLVIRADSYGYQGMNGAWMMTLGLDAVAT